MGGYVKSEIYVAQPETIRERRDRIIEMCASTTTETFQNVRNVLENTLFFCHRFIHLK